MTNGDNNRHTDTLIREMYGTIKEIATNVKRNQEWLKEHQTKIDETVKVADRAHGRINTIWKVFSVIGTGIVTGVGLVWASILRWWDS